MAINHIQVTSLADGSELEIYLHELKGDMGEGPTVGICAGVHGDESTGVLIVREIKNWLSEKAFRGRLLLLPVANPLAYGASKRATPDEYLAPANLNRTFPGNPDGSLTEQLAAVISERFLNTIDVFFDIHSGGASQTVDYAYIHNEEQLSRSFGAKVLYRAPHGKGVAGESFRGTASAVCERRGIPAVTIEIGGGFVDQRPYVDRGVAGIQNMLRYLNLVDEDIIPLPKQVVVKNIASIRPHVGGLLETEESTLGEEVSVDTVLGRVVSSYTFEELEVIRNPVADGILILSHLTTDVVRPGDYGYLVGDPENSGST